MPVLRDVKTRLEKRDVLRGLGIRVGAPVRPEIDRLIDEMLGDDCLRALIRPAIAYEIFGVREVRGDDFSLENGTVLHGATLPRLFASARMLVIAVATIGPGIEEKSTAYFKQGSRLKGLILDAMGTPAAENMRFSVEAVIAKEASGRGLTASSPVSPGSAGWPLTEQFKLFTLVPAGAIGVHLTETAMMLPRKSMSMAMGMGDNMPTWSATERCNNCLNGANCPYRYTTAHECDDATYEPALH